MDSDNDEWKDGACAVEHGGAWWYKECDKRYFILSTEGALISLSLQYLTDNIVIVHIIKEPNIFQQSQWQIFYYCGRTQGTIDLLDIVQGTQFPSYKNKDDDQAITCEQTERPGWTIQGKVWTVCSAQILFNLNTTLPSHAVPTALAFWLQRDIADDTIHVWSYLTCKPKKEQLMLLQKIVESSNQRSKGTETQVSRPKETKSDYDANPKFRYDGRKEFFPSYAWK